jgi:hypothetical protein
MDTLHALHPPPCACRFTTITVCAAAATTTAESLEESFGRKVLRFVSGGAPTAELSMRNGNSLHLRLGDGLVTSYRPKVYRKDDGCPEVLHTVADPGGNPTKAKGGIGLVLNEVSLSQSLIDGCEWTVKDTDSGSCMMNGRGGAWPGSGHCHG